MWIQWRVQRNHVQVTEVFKQQQFSDWFWVKGWAETFEKINGKWVWPSNITFPGEFVFCIVLTFLLSHDVLTAGFPNHFSSTVRDINSRDISSRECKQNTRDSIVCWWHLVAPENVRTAKSSGKEKTMTLKWLFGLWARQPLWHPSGGSLSWRRDPLIETPVHRSQVLNSAVARGKSL